MTATSVADGQGRGTIANDDADETAPDTTVDAGPANPSTSQDAVFGFSATDSGGTGLAGFECKLDTGTFSACSSPQSYGSLSDGVHTFEVRATDGAGNTDPTPASFTWTIDATPSTGTMGTPQTTQLPPTPPALPGEMLLQTPAKSVFGRSGS